MSLIIVVWIVLYTSKVNSNINGFTNLYSHSQAHPAYSVFLDVPLWFYWSSSLLICAVLITKDWLIKKPFARFLINMAVLWFAGYVCSTVISAVTIGTFDLIQVIR